MTEKLIGFDCCEMNKNFLQTWDEQRKKLYLLSDKIKKPLSVDRNVWENAFEVENPGIYGLWTNLSLMKQQTEETQADCWNVAVSLLLSDPGQSKEPLVESVFTDPKTLQHLNTEFLGYDIADDALISGLMNCGYGESVEKENWANRINEYHLFDFTDDAIQFKIYSDKRVAEHAPFRVYGIYKLI